jgi:integrase
VGDIDQQDIRDALAPIWAVKQETGRKALSCLKIIFKFAAAEGYSVDLQAIDNAQILLGRNDYVPRGIEAMPWEEVPEFYRSLSDLVPAVLALRMLILTGVRSDAVNHMRACDVHGDVWTVPAENVKGTKMHSRAFRVPLAPEARRVVDLSMAVERNGYLFPNSRGGPLNKMSMRNLMVARGLAARPHGFRSSLRTWLSEQTDCDNLVAETCLCHVAESQVARAYNRTDHLGKRRHYMQLWASHLTGAGSVSVAAE